MFTKILTNFFKSRQTEPKLLREFPKERVGKIIYNQKKCEKNYDCVKYCPSNAIRVKPDGFIEIDDAKCIRCGICIRECPKKALRSQKESQ